MSGKILALPGIPDKPARHPFSTAGIHDGKAM
jgi:hypothetical protein